MATAHHCGRCGTRIIYARTQAGKRQPLDWVPDHQGSVAAYQDALGVWHARAIKASDPPVRAPEKVFMPHQATCPAPRVQVVTPDSPAVPAGVTSLADYRKARRKRGKRRRSREATP